MCARGTLIGPVGIILACLVAALAALAAEPGGGPDPVVKQWPGWPGEVSCGIVPFKPLVAFAGPTDAERGELPSEVALRKFLEKGILASEGVRAHGWRLLGETPYYAEFGNGRLASGSIETMIVRHGQRGWRWSSYSSGCLPQVIRHRRPAVTWSLAPGQHPGPSTRSVKVNLGPGECASGQSQDERLERPQFREENGALLMALWLRPVHGPQTCPGILEPPVKIRLPHRLGHLRLLDGSVFPPQPPVEREG
ncbi:MAG TPA: hypothetical protein VHE08_04000 [Solirubrobacterales bacterium]|nr:hypothetical protein [Solirubrobacterales bacterium]